MLRHPPYHLVITAMQFHGETAETMAGRLGISVERWNDKVMGKADFSLFERKRIRSFLPYNGVDIFITEECDVKGTYEEEEYHREAE